MEYANKKPCHTPYPKNSLVSTLPNSLASCEVRLRVVGCRQMSTCQDTVTRQFTYPAAIESGTTLLATCFWLR